MKKCKEKEKEESMKCVRCEKNPSTVLVEHEDGSVEPVCDSCYMDSSPPDICPKCGCQCYDPFGGEILVHNVEACIGKIRILSKV